MSSPAEPADDDYADRLARLDERLRTDWPASAEDFADAAGVRKQDAKLLGMLRHYWASEPRPPETLAAPGGFSSVLRAGAGAPVSLGRFRIERELGRGGFGVVFQAYDPQHQRSIALKVPRPEVLASREARQRFLQEAEAAARFDHPHVVCVLEVGTVGDMCYLVSECCPGGSLADQMAPGQQEFSPRQAAQLVAALASGVAYVHCCGLLHRDIKPSNVLLWPEDGHSAGTSTAGFVPRLTDFGLAKVVDDSLLATGTSVLLGTPMYMAPEQAACDHASLGPWTDVYSLGVVLYELLAGRPPFVGPGLAAVLDQLRLDEPPSPRTLRAATPRDLEQITLRCLAKEPADRYQTAGDLEADLTRFLEGGRVLARPRGILRKLLSWVRQPQRVREAGIYMVTLNGAVIVWMITQMPYFLLAPGITIDAWAMTRDCAIVAAVLDIPQVIVGGFTILRRRWAVWCGIVLAAVNVAFSIAGQVGWFVPFGNLYDDSSAVRILMFGFMSAMFVVELLLFIAAALAITAPARRKGRDSAVVRERLAQ